MVVGDDLRSAPSGGGWEDGRAPAMGGQPALVSDRGPARIADLRDELAARVAGVHAAAAAIVALVGEVARDGGWAGPGLRSLGHWGSIELGLPASEVNAMAETAERLRRLPALAEEFASGCLGFAKVRAVAEVATPDVEADLVELARQGTVEQVRRICGAYRRATADDAEGEKARDGRRGRGLWREPGEDRDGLVRLVAKLAPEDAEVVMAAVRAHAEDLWRDEHGRDEAVGDEAAAGSPSGPAGDRSVPGVDGDGCDPEPFEPRAARLADALVALAETGLAAGPTPASGGERAEVVLHVDAGFLSGATDVGRCAVDHGGSVTRQAARRLACDCMVSVMVAKALGRPLGVGATTRTVPRWLRRALRERDGGCAFPGCGHTRWVEAHHVVHWVDGGPTDLANLVLLCRRHHVAVHDGGFRVVVHASGRVELFRPDGTPVLPPPRPADRARVPRPLVDVDPAARAGGTTDWSMTDTLAALTSRHRATAPPD